MKHIRQVVKTRLDEGEGEPVQAKVIGDDLKRHGRRKTHQVSQGIFVARLLRQPREIPDVLPLDLDLLPPVNVLRLSLHPDGLAPRIRNLTEWRARLLHRLQQQIEVTQDPQLVALRRELHSLPAPQVTSCAPASAIAVPIQLEVRGQVLSMISTTTVFGSPVDITLSELALEAFVPADATTAEILQQMASR